MNIAQAKALKYGERVACPADRGQPAFIGTVRTATEILEASTVHKNVWYTQYIWVEVLRPGHGKTLWPSNRLGKCDA